MADRFVASREDGKPTFLHTLDRKKFRQVIWGDFLRVRGETADGWLEVDWAWRSPTQRRTLYIPKADTTAQRPLEIVFVDVGQGDGAVLISPETGAEEDILVIDAGEGPNMQKFLEARFRTSRGFDFQAAVVTHPDTDHYLGFKALFENHEIGFETVYHNGLVERPVSGSWEKLGDDTAVDPDTNITYYGGLGVDRATVAALVADAGPRFEHAATLQAALDNPRVGDIRMLSTVHAQREDGAAWLPGFAPSDRRGYSLRVLGPVAEHVAGQDRLRKLSSSYGETKNGHSVILRLQYGRFSVLFGGDLNEVAEKFMLQHHTGRTRFPKPDTADHRAMVQEARGIFGADVMKSCHHGSEKVTDAFLEAVNPAAFIISSGDREAHVHPRPDLLGRLGRFGRGGSPVILSTELQRSTRAVEDPAKVAAILKRIDKLAAGTLQAEAVVQLKTDVQALARSNVEVHGAIYLKTDGERLMTAFRIESGSELEKWFAFRYRFKADGTLVREN